MINERMLELINAVSKGNKRAFSMLVGVTPTVIENIVGARKGKPGYDLLEKIAFAIENINLDWLLTGRGSMLRADEPPTNSVTPSTDAPAASAKPDESILYNMYKDLQAEKEKIRLEKEAKIEELNAKIFKMSEEIGRLKAKLGEDEPETHPKGLGTSETAKRAATKPHSSTSETSASYARNLPKNQ